MNLADKSASFRTPSERRIDLANLLHDRERLPRNSLASDGSTCAIGVLEGVDSDNLASWRRKNAAASTAEPAPRIPITSSTLSAFGQADRNVDEDAVRVTYRPDQIGKYGKNTPTALPRGSIATKNQPARQPSTPYAVNDEG